MFGSARSQNLPKSLQSWLSGTPWHKPVVVVVVERVVLVSDVLVIVVVVVIVAVEVVAVVVQVPHKPGQAARANSPRIESAGQCLP